MRALSKTVGSRANAGLQLGILMDSIAKNNERYTNWKYKYKADAMDIIGTGFSIGVGAGGAVVFTPVLGVGAGIFAAAGANYYIEREKVEMDKQDKEETKKRGESK